MRVTKEFCDICGKDISDYETQERFTVQFGKYHFCGKEIVTCGDCGKPIKEQLESIIKINPESK